MKNLITTVTIGAICSLLLLTPAAHAGKIATRTHRHSSSTNVKAKINKAASALFAEEVSSLYEEINLRDYGLSQKAFQYAYTGYKYLLQHHALNRSDVISICDFSQSSKQKRMYVVDIEQRKLLLNTYVAHGRKSGSEFARSFSNNPESHKSSLGFYVTDQSYYGDHGLSLKIHGLEKGFNDRAASRNIVIHGSEYVGPDFLKFNSCNGRSFGCPAVPSAESADLIETIKNGSCLFIYYPAKKYIAKSKILNS